MYSQLQLTGQKKGKEMSDTHTHRGHSGTMSTCPPLCSVDFTYLLLLLQQQGAKKSYGNQHSTLNGRNLISVTQDWQTGVRTNVAVTWQLSQQTVSPSQHSPSQMTTGTVWGDSRHISTQRSSSACHTLEQLSLRSHWRKFWNAPPEPLHFLLLFNRGTW